MVVRFLIFAVLFICSNQSLAQSPPRYRNNVIGGIQKTTGKALPQFDPCEDIDLNAADNSPLRRIPMYSQGATNMCYSYAASQLIDFYRFKNGDNSYDLTNPIYAAWTYKLKQQGVADRESMEYGNSWQLILALKENGICKNSEVQARLSVLAKSGNLSETQLVEMLEQSYAENGPPIVRMSQLVGMQAPTNDICPQRQTLEAQLRRYNLFGIASTAALDPLLRNCRKISLNIPNPETVTNINDEAFGRNIESVLRSGYPAGLSYCSQILNNRRFQGAPRGQENWSRLPSNECWKHVSLITGQTNFGGQCHYLIRNTVGPLHREPTATACACINASGKYEASCTERNPKRIVGCWLPRERVVNNSYSIVTLR